MLHFDAMKSEDDPSSLIMMLHPMLVHFGGFYGGFHHVHFYEEDPVCCRPG